VVNYWRLTEDNRLLFGGGESYGYRFPDIVATVRKPMLQVYPQLADARIDHAWGGTLAITMNRMPCFLRVRPNVLSASGYSGHGVAMATMAGRIMAEAVARQAGASTDGPPADPRFPGGAACATRCLVLAMTWYRPARPAGRLNGHASTHRAKTPRATYIGDKGPEKLRTGKPHVRRCRAAQGPQSV
jgi:gamma-glutamylputrescine oxidase